MKKSLFSLSAAILFVASGFLTSCESPEKKVEAAKENVAEAKQELTEAQRNAQIGTYVILVYPLRTLRETQNLIHQTRHHNSRVLSMRCQISRKWFVCHHDRA